mgnify:CR=1 FL=1
MDFTSLVGIGDAEDLETADGINRLCERINEREKQVNDNLEILLSRKFNLEIRLHNAHVKHQQLFKASVFEDSRKLTDMISHTADLAEKVSAKVRRFDTARNRANEAQKRVHDLIGLSVVNVE